MNSDENKQPVAPHQKHYHSKMRKQGWMDEAGNMIWPKDFKERQEMARTLFGSVLVSNVDYWILLGNDELDDSYKAPWADPERKPSPREMNRRKIFKTLDSEQREAVRELVRRIAKGQLHSHFADLDQKIGAGGVTISIDHPDDGYGERLEIHSPEQDELHGAMYQWLEDFSMVFGTDERG